MGLVNSILQEVRRKAKHTSRDENQTSPILQTFSDILRSFKAVTREVEHIF